MIICVWHRHVEMGNGSRSRWRGILSRLAWRLASESALFESAPFEILLVASALYVALGALLAGWFRLVALESFRLARYTTIATLGLLPLGDASRIRGFRFILSVLRRLLVRAPRLLLCGTGVVWGRGEEERGGWNGYNLRHLPRSRWR